MHIKDSLIKNLSIRISDFIALRALGLIIILLIISAELQSAPLVSQYVDKGGFVKETANSNNDKVIIFVHGFGGDPQETWKSNDGTWFPKLASEDSKLEKFDVFVADYYLDGDEKEDTTVFGLAQNLIRILEKYAIFGSNSRYKEIYFVTHSMGNIVTRTSLILSHKKHNHPVAPLIISFASPSDGSELTESHLAALSGNTQQLNDMQLLEKNSFLSLLNVIWKSQAYDTEIACAYEGKSTAFLWFDRIVVTKESATSDCKGFDPDHKELNEDHFSIVKPKNSSSEIYIWFREQLIKKERKKGWEHERWKKKEIILAGKDYPESNIHTAMIALILRDQLEAAGYTITSKYRYGDGRKLFSDLKNRNIDIYIEYSGSILFAYLDDDPIAFNKRHKVNIDKQHGKAQLNKLMHDNGLNMVFYAQFGFSSPFQLIMNKESAKALKLIDDDNEVKLSRLIKENRSCVILGETGFFYRNDGFIGLEKHYGPLNFTKKYAAHVDTYDDLLGTQENPLSCVVGVSYATDPELSDPLIRNQLIIINDDQELFPEHVPGILAHSFLERGIPDIEIEKTLSKINFKEIIPDEKAMATLNKEGTEIWKKNLSECEFGKKIEGMVGDFLKEKGVLKNAYKYNKC